MFNPPSRAWSRVLASLQCCALLCLAALYLFHLSLPAGAGAKGPGPVYWGFTVTANLLPLTAQVLNTSKLMVVFDIDETLLTASTVDSLQARLRRVKTAR